MIHILVVEDDADLNRAVCKQFSAHHYDAAGALSAPETGSVFTVKLKL